MRPGWSTPFPRAMRPLPSNVATRTTTGKVRNVRAHPDAAFVFRSRGRIGSAFPPRDNQFQGTATAVPADHAGAVRAHE